jgi:hypothetical protein
MKCYQSNSFALDNSEEGPLIWLIGSGLSLAALRVLFLLGFDRSIGSSSAMKQCNSLEGKVEHGLKPWINGHYFCM